MKRILIVLIVVMLLEIGFLSMIFGMDPPESETESPDIDPNFDVNVESIRGYNSSWVSALNISIVFSGSETLTDYPVNITLPYYVGMNANFSDIRFVDVANTSLSYWIEDYIASTSAIVWVKVPSIPATGTWIHLKFGNENATDESDGRGTFTFFEDFDNVTDGVEQAWDFTEVFSEDEMQGSHFLHLADIDGDDDYELLCDPSHDTMQNIAAIEMNGSIIWENELTADFDNPGYYPKVADLDQDGVMEIVYSDRSDMWCINADDGSYQWNSTLNFEVVELGDLDGDGYLEVLGGARNSRLYALNGTTGAEIWNNTDALPYEQGLSTGDIDGDGKDEVVCGTDDDNNVTWVIDDNGTTLYNITFEYEIHHDLIYITEFNSTSPGKEIVLVKGPSDGEGQRVGVYNASDGAFLSESVNLSTAAQGPSFRIGDFRPDLDGYEIGYAAEEEDKVGMLANNLTQLWEIDTFCQAGQTTAADINGNGTTEFCYGTDEGVLGQTIAMDGFGNVVHFWPKYFGWSPVQISRGNNSYGGEVFTFNDYDNDSIDELLLSGGSRTDSYDPMYATILSMGDYADFWDRWDIKDQDSNYFRLNGSSLNMSSDRDGGAAWRQNVIGTEQLFSPGSAFRVKIDSMNFSDDDNDDRFGWIGFIKDDDEVSLDYSRQKHISYMKRSSHEYCHWVWKDGNADSAKHLPYSPRNSSSIVDLSWTEAQTVCTINNASDYENYNVTTLDTYSITGSYPLMIGTVSQNMVVTETGSLDIDWVFVRSHVDDGPIANITGIAEDDPWEVIEEEEEESSTPGHGGGTRYYGRDAPRNPSPEQSSSSPTTMIVLAATITMMAAGAYVFLLNEGVVQK